MSLQLDANATTPKIVLGAGSSTLLLPANGGTRLLGYMLAQINGLRLSLSSSAAVADGTGANVYAVPYTSNEIALYSALTSQWTILTVPTWISVAGALMTTGRPYDVFAYNASGTPALELVAWTSTSARATGLTTQDGVLVKSGDASRRYMGTVVATGAAQFTDNGRQRLLWNWQNRVRRRLVFTEATATWTYTTAAWRQANNAAANQVEVVVGVAGDTVELHGTTHAANSAGGVTIQSGIGIDSTAAPSSGSYLAAQATTAAGLIVSLKSTLVTEPAAGFHFYPLLEFSNVGGTTTWSGSGVLSGILGSCMA